MNEQASKLPSERIEENLGIPELRESEAKILFSVIPYVGTALSEIFFDFPNRVKQNRVNKLVILLKEKIENIEGGLVSMEYLQTEDFHDLSVLTFETATKIRQEERRKGLADLYINSLQEESNFEMSKYRVFIEFISNLTETQILLLKFVVDKENELVEIATFPNFYETFNLQHPDIELGKYEFKYAVNDMENKGLITLEDGLSDFSSNSSLLADESHKAASVKITDYGKEFIEYLKK